MTCPHRACRPAGPAEPLFRAIGKVQKANGLPVDGLLLPLRNGRVGENGEGETLMSLQGLLGERLRGQPIPTPQQVDSFFETYARDPDAPRPFFRTMEKRRDDPEPTLQTMEWRGPENARIQLLSADAPDEAPASPPVAGEQTAALPAALMAAPYLLGAGVLGMGASQYIQQQGKNRGETFTPPSRPMSDGEKEQTAAPPLQPPQADTSLQGRPAADKLPDGEHLIPPETKEWISGLPPAQQPVAEGLAGIILEINPYGSRGKPETEKANRIMVRSCMETLQEYPNLAGKLEHVAGSYKKGKEGGDYMKEEVIRALDGSNSFSRPDASFGRLDDKNEKVDQDSPYTARMNTVDTKKTGDEHDRSSLTANEGRRFDKLEGNIRVGVAGWARKMKPGESEADYAVYTASRCRAMWEDLDDKLRRGGLLPAR